MTAIRPTLIFSFVGILGLSACRDKPPCTNCDEDVAGDNDHDAEPDLPMPDLPCGGADLMTDNLNCGMCGHECILGYPGTQYEAGSCKGGECSPGSWTDCVANSPDYPEENCAEVCAGFGWTCVPNGCAGLTGMMSDVLFGEGCGPGGGGPIATFSGGCDDPIPWMTPSQWLLTVQCCCDVQAGG